MTFEWLVALRYLRSPNRPAVLRLVTLLAVIGVAAGVTTLVIALSMNTGFRQAIRDRLLSVTAHVNLKPLGPDGIHDYRELMTQLSGVSGVRSIEPAIYNTVLLSCGGRARGVVLKGVGGAPCEIAWRGIQPKKPNIEPCGLDIDHRWKRVSAWVERPHRMRGV